MYVYKRSYFLLKTITIQNCRWTDGVEKLRSPVNQQHIKSIHILGECLGLEKCIVVAGEWGWTHVTTSEVSFGSPDDSGCTLCSRHAL